MNHFGCLKLVNCLQFCFLSALIVSRIAYTIGICLPFVCFDGCTTPPKKKKTVVSGLVSKSLVFASFCFGFGLIQINPERYCNVTRSYSIKTALDFIGPLYILLGFLRQTKACFKRMAYCVHRGFCILKDHLGVMLLSKKTLLLQNCCTLWKTCRIDWWHTLLR